VAELQKHSLIQQLLEEKEGNLFHPPLLFTIQKDEEQPCGLFS
jgi:hypothetical protein